MNTAVNIASTTRRETEFARALAERNDLVESLVVLRDQLRAENAKLKEDVQRLTDELAANKATAAERDKK